MKIIKIDKDELFRRLENPDISLRTLPNGTEHRLSELLDQSTIKDRECLNECVCCQRISCEHCIKEEPKQTEECNGGFHQMEMLRPTPYPHSRCIRCGYETQGYPVTESVKEDCKHSLSMIGASFCETCGASLLYKPTPEPEGSRPVVEYVKDITGYAHVKPKSKVPEELGTWKPEIDLGERVGDLAYRLNSVISYLKEKEDL